MAKSKARPTHPSFGRYVRALRCARGLTQEQVAELAGLSPDTIRRLEHSDFSPSLRTLDALATGLRLSLSTLFTAYELAEVGSTRELVDYAGTLDPHEVQVALRVLALLIQLLGASEGIDDGR